MFAEVEEVWSVWNKVVGGGIGDGVQWLGDLTEAVKRKPATASQLNK